MDAVTFSIPFAPIAKGRARSVFMPGRGIRHYTPKATADWEKVVALYARQACREPHQGALMLNVGFYMPIPPSWPAWKQDLALSGELLPTTKPDLDNLLKAIKDACNGISWLDDAQVVESKTWKAYSDHPRVYVLIQPIHKGFPAQLTKRPPTPQKETSHA